MPHDQLSQQELNSRKLRRGLLIFMGVFSLFGMLACAYGHAAVNSDLYIEGEGTIARTGTQFDSKYMQDVTPAECQALEFDATSQLIDKRDGRSYWVAKLRDGNCWMVQDLKFDLVADENGNVELTSELTDINPPTDPDDHYYETEVKNGKTIYKWNQNVSSLAPEATFYTNVNSKQTNNTVYSWNLGEYVVRPNGSSVGTRIFVTDEDEEGNLVQVYTPSNDLPNNTIYDNETMTYDTHYLIGNYYQWNTATASSWYLGAEPSSSICPKGWRIPEVPDSGTPYDVAITAYRNAGISYTLNAWPFYFARGGQYINTSLDVIGQRTSYWAAWLTRSRVPYVTSLVNPSNNITTGYPSRNTGYSVFQGLTMRCVLRME